jgi:hypothetical protein
VNQECLIGYGRRWLRHTPRQVSVNGALLVGFVQEQPAVGILALCLRAASGFGSKRGRRPSRGESEEQ